MKNVLWLGVVALACAAGCAMEGAGGAEQALGGTCSSWGGTFSTVTFSDEQANNAIDFADHATAAELEGLAGVGPTIASSIIAARPFASKADPIASLDAVSRVGGTVLTSFRDQSYGLWCAIGDGRQSCCVDLGCSGLGGTASGVTFTDVEAVAVLEWANHASDQDLKLVCGVGDTLATSLIAARPMRTLAQLDAVSGVGATALHRFLGHEGYQCASKVSALVVWCGSSECTCDGSAPIEPPPSGPEWSAVPSTLYKGELQTTGGAVLPDGSLLIAGQTYAEILDRDTLTLTRTGDPVVSRTGHVVATLSDGRVLMAGGQLNDTAEIWNPATGTWSLVAPMNHDRNGAAAVVLTDGRVFVVGGWSRASGSLTASNSGEIYDPATNQWTLVGPMSAGHIYHRAARMADGRVMIVGITGTLPEVFDPRTNTFRTTGVTRVRDGFALAVLSTGRVIVTGGVATGGAAQEYDAIANAWLDLAPMPISVYSHAVAALSDGRMFIAGGWQQDIGPTARSFVYDPATNAWSEVGSMPNALHQVTARTLGDGRVAVFGRGTIVNVWNPWSSTSPPPPAPSSTTTIDDRAQLDSALNAVIDQLIADGNTCDSSSPNAVTFSYVVVYRQGDLVRYEVVLSQHVGDGLSWSLRYDLDASYQVTGGSCDIG